VSAARAANLGLRLLLELAAVAAVVTWGFRAGGSLVARLALGVGAAALVAVVWGVFVAPRSAVSLPRPVKFGLGLAILLLAALALAAVGLPALAAAFGALVLLNAALILRWQQ
jgi:hypothetical protein